MLFPGHTDHHVEPVLGGHIEEPAWRNGVDADGVEAVCCHHGKVALDQLEYLLSSADDDELESQLYGAVETARALGVEIDEATLESRRSGVRKALRAGEKLNAPTEAKAEKRR